jgi:hypothetical protein
MTTIRELVGLVPDRIGPATHEAFEAWAETMASISEGDLLWIYIAPGTQLSALSGRLVTFAVELLAPGTGAILQIHEPHPADVPLLSRCRVLASYLDETVSPGSVNLHVVLGE